MIGKNDRRSEPYSFIKKAGLGHLVVEGTQRKESARTNETLETR